MSFKKLVLGALRAKVEYEIDQDWGMVYLDNAKPDWMTPTTFRAWLAALSKDGLYQVEDGYAWGRVRLTDQGITKL